MNLKKYFHKILFCYYMTSVVRDFAKRFLYFNVLKFLSVDNYIDSLSLRQCHCIIQNQMRFVLSESKYNILKSGISSYYIDHSVLSKFSMC